MLSETTGDCQDVLFPEVDDLCQNRHPYTWA